MLHPDNFSNVRLALTVFFDRSHETYETVVSILMAQKVFISSLIGGMESYRAAAREAVTQLDFEAVMAEDFGAQPVSPQVACLTGLRSAAVVVLILGEHYGAVQPSGLSATHEEYAEARGSRPVFAFLQKGVKADSRQAEFIAEAGRWDAGLFREEFSTPDELRHLVTQRLHRWAMAQAKGPVNGQALLDTALAALPERQRGFVTYDRTLTLVVAAGPVQTMLRPALMDDATLHNDLKQHVLFGDVRVFAEVKTVTVEVERSGLVLDYDNGKGQVRVDAKGTVVVRLPLTGESHGMVLIEEQVEDVLRAALRFAAWVLDWIDPTQKLTDVALAVDLGGSSSATWRTRAEHAASPNSYQMNMNDDRKPVHLDPPACSRPALVQQSREIVEDFISLLRRQHQSRY